MRNFARWFLICVVLGHTVVVRSQTPTPGNALSFDGTTGDYVIRSAFNSLAQFTVEFWMKTTDTSKEGTPFSLAVSGEDNMITIFDYRNFHVLLNGEYVPSSAGTDVRANDGRWHHIAITFDRSNGQFKFYRDGFLAHETVTNQIGLLIPSGGTVVIGQEQDSLGGGFQSSQAFLGTIDELRVWGVVRSAFNIENDMHRSLPSGTTGLVLYYRFDETSGTTVTDSSGRNQHGTLVGAARVTSDAPVGLPPTANTFAAQNIGTTSATLNGSVDPNGIATKAYFRWGLTTSLANRTFTNVVTGSVAVSQQRTLSGLQPSSTYYFQMHAQNDMSSAAGVMQSFSTLGPPSATTDPATFVTSDSATLNATVNPRNSDTTVYFQYGLTTSYGLSTATNNVGSGTDNVQASLPITELIFNTNYYYRVVASNSRGTTFGSARTFRTQIFGDINAGISGMSRGNLAWGDYDNDADLDLLVTGFGAAPLWRNDGDGNFAAVSSALTAMSDSSCAWGDFDNDGDLDVVLAGSASGTRTSRIWRNDGNGVFVDINARLAGVNVGATAWGDYDNDGAPDLVIAGTTNGSFSGAICHIYRNNGNSMFSNVGASLPGIMDCSVAWGDYDNDGDLDLAIAGLDSGNVLRAQVRRNDGNGIFTDINAALRGVRKGSMAWGDYDSDGYLDLLLTGTTNSGVGNLTQIWRNNRNGGFSNINAALPAVAYGASAWADFDNDGDLDLVLTGYNDGLNPARIAQLHRNNGNGTFSAVSASLTEVADSAVAWGDYDNDGDLDLAVAGDTGPQYITQIRRNDSFPANTIPSAPTGLTSSSTGTDVTLRWNLASDAQTPAAGLTYSLRIGSVPGVSDVVGPQADIANGYRLLPGLGNVQYGTNALVNLIGLPGGTYYWSVQAVDSGVAGGPFSAEQTFELAGRPFANTLAPTNPATDRATLQGIVNPGGRVTTGWFEFGATTNYGSVLGSNSLGNGFTNIGIEADVSGLLPDAIYHYRAVARNILGTSAGADLSFQTRFMSVSPPVVALTLPPGTATNFPVTLNNHIASAVNVTNRFASPAPAYAALLQTNRTLPPSGTATIDLLFDTSDLEPGLHQSAIEVDAGSNHVSTLVPVELTVLAPGAPEITQVTISSNRTFELRFSGTGGFAHQVLATTNVAAPLGQWVLIGNAMQVAPGVFQFTDPGATNYPQRFYRVRVP